MIAACWVRSIDIDCAMCEQAPNVKKRKGCTEDGQILFRYPPEDVSSSVRAEFTRCPAQCIGPDVWALVDTWRLCGGKLTLTEADSLPAPYRQAWSMVDTEIKRAQGAELEKARK